MIQLVLKLIGIIDLKIREKEVNGLNYHRQMWKLSREESFLCKK